MKKLILTVAFILLPVASFAGDDQIQVKEYYNATNMIPSLDSYIDVVLNDLSETEKNELKTYLKSQKVDLSKKVPDVTLVKNDFKIGNKKIKFDYQNLSFKINGYNWKYDETKTVVQHVEILTKYFQGAAGFSQLFVNKAYAEEASTSYFAHGLEVSAMSAVGAYGVMKAAHTFKKGNLVNWNNGSGFVSAALMVGGISVGYIGSIVSGTLWAGQSLALLIANNKASIVCENGKIFIKIDGKLISPDSLKSDAVNSETALKYLSKTYTCTKTITSKIAAEVMLTYKSQIYNKEKSGSTSTKSNNNNSNSNGGSSSR